MVCLAGLARWVFLPGLYGVKPTPKPPVPEKHVNLALGRPAIQSSTYAGTGEDQRAARGVDGKRAKDPGDMFHTKADNPPWWILDLGGNYTLSMIRLHNRPHAQTMSKANTIEVLTSEDGSRWSTLYRHDGSDWRVLDVPTPRPARYIRLQLRKPVYFHLMEVEVWGDPSHVTLPR